MIKINQVEIWSQIAVIAINYIVVNSISNANQKLTVQDSKTDIRSTKEDIMAEMKDTRETLLRESEVSTKAIIDIIKSEIKAQVESVEIKKGI